MENNKKPIYVVLTHYISDEGTFNTLSEKAKYLHKAVIQAKETIPNMKFGLKLTVAEDKISSQLSQRVNKLLQEIAKDKIWILYDPQNRGAGTSLRQILFNPTFTSPPSYVLSVDLDQFVIHTEEAQKQLVSLTEKMKKENSLYGNGLRDVPVVLGIHKRNSNLRIIRELFHSLAIGKNKLLYPAPSSNISPSYASIGESTTGVYSLYTGHEKFNELYSSLTRAMQKADFNGFVNHYFLVLKAAELSPISGVYVKSKENQFYSEKSEEEEYNSIMKSISYETKNLGKTEVGEKIKQALNKKENIKILERFFNKDDVQIVQKQMLDALSEK